MTVTRSGSGWIRPPRERSELGRTADHDGPARLDRRLADRARGRLDQRGSADRTRGRLGLGEHLRRRPADFDILGHGSWTTESDPDSGRYARGRSRATVPQLLLPRRAPDGDVRIEADVRLRDDDGRVGLVLASAGRSDHAVAWLDSTGTLSVEVTRDRKVVRKRTARLHANTDPRTWHSLTAEMRDGAAHVQVSSAMLDMPLAELTVDVPKGWRRGGVASTRGAGEADNVGVTRLYTPVTVKQPVTARFDYVRFSS
ncbi:hypothetical protein [Streptomyces asiaticus]|uniref:hypothetical protein n=1 Tax=Streptomyces asiaticus TaxID=114695 RepID=UPI000A366C95